MRGRALGAALTICVALAACGPDEQPGNVLNRGNGGEPSSLDPQAAMMLSEANIATDMFMGLFTVGPDGKPIPGMAERWETSPDGLIWTFHLRAAAWSDGAPVTAEDFVFAWRRMLDPASAMTYASLLYPFKNAQAINEGRLPTTTLGARAQDARTLELTLEHPAPYLPELLSHPTTMPVPKHIVAAKGGAWTKRANIVTNGPYMLKEWGPNDHIELVKNPRFYDAQDVEIDAVTYYPTTNYFAALNRMRAGLLDVQDPMPSQMIDWLKAKMPDALQRTPSLAVYYIDINLRRQALSDKRVREALNLGFDRETFTEKIRKLDEPVAYNIVPPNVAGYPGGAGFPFKSMPMAERIARAQNLMREAGYGPDHPLRLSYLTSGNSDPLRLAAVLQNMWRTIYVDLAVEQNEPQIVSRRRRAGDFDLAYANWLADYDDAESFLGTLFTSSSAMNAGGYKNPAFDALIAAADQERDGTKRGALLRQAEDMLLADYVVVPYRFGMTGTLVAPYVKGWIANAKDYNPTRFLSIEAHTSP